MQNSNIQSKTKMKLYFQETEEKKMSTTDILYNQDTL